MFIFASQLIKMTHLSSKKIVSSTHEALQLLEYFTKHSSLSINTQRGLLLIVSLNNTFYVARFVYVICL